MIIIIMIIIVWWSCSWIDRSVDKTNEHITNKKYAKKDAYSNKSVFSFSIWIVATCLNAQWQK